MRLSSRPLPPYSYVPGLRPHPISDPAGHAFGNGAGDGDAEPLDPDSWWTSADYCWAIDLFNAGYYWEAHEAWEQLWIAAGRNGLIADFLKGLIKLAAAGVKLREGNPRGVRRHAARAGDLIQLTRHRLGPDTQSYAGLHLVTLTNCAERLAANEGPDLHGPDASRMLDPLPLTREPPESNNEIAEPG